MIFHADRNGFALPTKKQPYPLPAVVSFLGSERVIMKNKSDKTLSVFRVTVERERVIKERRVVRVLAYTPDSAKMIAKQKRPSEGWTQTPLAKNQNSAVTTTFGASCVEYLGLAEPLPDDAGERHRLLNDSSHVLKIEGEA